MNPLTRSEIIPLYRRLLRIAQEMPDSHRTAFVCYRARSEIEDITKLSASEESKAREVLLSLDTFADQLEHQARHLSNLAQDPTSVLVPVDLRTDQPTPHPGRKLITALSSRQRTHRQVSRNRFLTGPTPSWLKNT